MAADQPPSGPREDHPESMDEQWSKTAVMRVVRRGVAQWTTAIAQGRLRRAVALVVCAVLAAGVLWWGIEAGSSSSASSPSVPEGSAEASVPREYGEAPRTVAGRVDEGATIYIPHSGGQGHTICTVGAVIDHGTTAITAGHCGYLGAQAYLSTEPQAPAVAEFVDVGGPDHDLAYLRVLDTIPTGPDSTLNTTSARPHTAIAKHGSATARTQGTIDSGDLVAYPVFDRHGKQIGQGQGIRASLCAEGGDSGAPVYETGTATIIGFVIAAGAGRTPEWCYAYLAPASWVANAATN